MPVQHFRVFHPYAHSCARPCGKWCSFRVGETIWNLVSRTIRIDGPASIESCTLRLAHVLRTREPGTPVDAQAAKGDHCPQRHSAACRHGNWMAWSDPSAPSCQDFRTTFQEHALHPLPSSPPPSGHRQPPGHRGRCAAARRRVRAGLLSALFVVTLTGLTFGQPAAHAATTPRSPIGGARPGGSTLPLPPGAPTYTQPAPGTPQAQPQKAARPKPGKSLGPATHCVISAVTKKETCYGTFREAISQATGGLVKDAPLTAAKMTPAQEAKINSMSARPKAGSTRPKGGMGAFVAPSADPNMLIEIDYEDSDYHGATHTWVGYDCALSGDWTWVGVPDLNSYSWGNRISSFIGFNSCYSYHFKGTNYSGEGFQGWASGYVNYVGDSWNDQINSIYWTHGPTARTLFSYCDSKKSAYCIFHPDKAAGIVESYAPEEAIGSPLRNCTSTLQKITLTSTKTTETSATAQGSMTVTVGAKASGSTFFATVEGSLEVAVMAAFSKTFTTTDTYSVSVERNVPAGKEQTLWRSTKLQTVWGQWEIGFSEPKWGYTTWWTPRMKVTSPVPKDPGAITWRETDISQTICAQQPAGLLTATRAR